jgi:hypothetical protein
MADEMFVDVSAEVQANVVQARQEAQSQFASLLDWIVEPNKQRLCDVEDGLWVRLRALGRALLALWFAGRRAVRAPRYVTGPDRRRYRWQGTNRATVKTSLGEVAFHRDFYVIGGGKRTDTFVPLDQELLGAQANANSFSLRAICLSVLLCAKMPFADARGTLQRFWGWAPATKSLMKMTDQVGPLARPFLEAQAAPLEDGEVLFVLVDSKGAPMITDTEMSRRRRPHQKRSADERRPWRRRRRRGTPRKRRKKGDKSKNAKMANVGVIYTLRVKDGMIEGPIEKRTYATFLRMEQLFIWIHAEALKRGYGAKRTIFLADGDRKIWKLQQKYFPLATACLDFFHVSEKLWSIGETLYAEGSDELSAWVKEQVADLKAGRTKQLLSRLRRLESTLPRSGPGTRGKRKRMHQGIAYLERNLGRLPYAELLRNGLDIGSGAVEGAVRQLGLRLDGPGMRWSPARAEYLLQLRCIVINGMWTPFEDHLVRHAHEGGGLRVIRPAGLGATHDAKRKQAA